MAEHYVAGELLPVEWSEHFPEFDQHLERFVSDRTLIGTVAFLIGLNLWFALVILYLDDAVSGRASTSF